MHWGHGMFKFMSMLAKGFSLQNKASAVREQSLEC